MANGYRADTATMQAVAKKIEGIHTTMEGDLAQLRQQLAEVAGVQWQGRAADAFGTTMAQWDRDALRMNQALDWISQRVQQSALQTDAVQDRGASALRSPDTGGQATGLGQFL